MVREASMLENCCGKVVVFLRFIGLKEEDNTFRIFCFGVNGIWWCYTSDEKMADLAEEARRWLVGEWKKWEIKVDFFRVFRCEEREKIKRDKEGVSKPGIQQVQVF